MVGIECIFYHFRELLGEAIQLLVDPVNGRRYEAARVRRFVTLKPSHGLAWL